MSFRIEDKLFIKPENILQFKNFLINKSAKKLYDNRIIRSLYFDNINLSMYTDSVEGSVPRKKIRIRHYPNSNDNNFYLEIKTSSVEGRYKTRKIINKKDYELYKKIGIFDPDYGTCLPNFYVSYKREYAKIEDVRISIDEAISYENFLSNSFFLDDKLIVELKTSINKNLDDFIKDFPFQKIRFSKYCFAVENSN
jgi:hypothetical protein